VTIALAPDFTWTPQELQRLAQMQPVLHTDLGTAANAVRHVLRMVKGHLGETAVGLVKKVLESYGIRCGHHGKVNAFLNLLCRWDWLYIKVPENWHKRQADGKQRRGRARTYGVGKDMQHKFRPVAGDGAKVLPVLHNPHTHRTYILRPITSLGVRLHPKRRVLSPSVQSPTNTTEPIYYVPSSGPPLRWFLLSTHGAS
jgi:hypothetical protein